MTFARRNRADPELMAQVPPIGEHLASGADATPDSFVELKEVSVHYRVPGRLGHGSQAKVIKAVDNVSLVIDRGSALGLVGETGSGKSTISQLIMGMVKPTSGTVTVLGQDQRRLSGKDLRNHRRHVQVVLQDPYSSLDPRMKVREIIAEPLTFGMPMGARAGHVRDRVKELLGLVGLPASKADLYPHQFSGGQRQRIAIARALAPEPEMIVLDEPTSALDVSVRAQILTLLRSLQAQLKVTYLVISHDLVTVAALATQVAVMFHGKIVEIGPVKRIYDTPSHPYTLVLLASAPTASGNFITGLQSAAAVDQSVPDTGCVYAPRCALRLHLGSPALCVQESPPLAEIGPGHLKACHFSESIGEIFGEDE